MKPISVKLRVLIYIVAFVATLAITYVVKVGGINGDSGDSNSMTSATLPVVYMTTENGLNYNYLHGYTGVVDETLIHDSITPISAERKLGISIKQYGNVISGVSYEIRSLDGTELVERNKVSDVTGSDGVSHANLGFKNLLDTGREYMLKIIITTEQSKSASYYTRIVIMDDAGTDAKLQYVNNFSAYTLDKDAIGNITAKLETNSTGDNTNLGRVNIHSRQSQVGFGDLNPELVSDRYITLNEIDGTVASVTVRYVLKTDDDSGTFTYNVKEAYRINQPDDTVTYVYSFDRWMDQIFSPDYAATSSGNMYLGITSSDTVAMEKSESGNITAFVRENHLWEYNSSKKKYVEVFTFSESEGDNIRESYDEHNIKILSVDNNGNMKFLVYGYMNRGNHEGMNGVAVFEYDAAENTTAEIVFIARKDSYKSIEKDIEKLAYLNESNILYMYQNGTVFYLDCTTKECMIVANNVISSSCIASDVSGMVIYQTDKNVYESSNVHLLNLETGEITDIEADEGSKIKALGFIDGNAVYGEAYDNMINVDADGNVNFPMYKVELVNANLEPIKTYEMDSVYITGVLFDGGKITLNRIMVNENGESLLADDYLLSNVKDTGELKLSIRSTERRQKEKYIALVGSAASSDYNKINARYVFSSDSAIEIADNAVEKDNRYYVYGYGELYVVTESLSEAIQNASESGGVVTDGNANVLWTRYKSSEAVIKISDNLISASDNSKLAATKTLVSLAGKTEDAKTLYSEGYSIADCVKEIFGNVCNLTGCDVEQVEYFIDRGYPVIAKTGSGKYQLIYAYTKTSVSAVDFELGQKVNYNISEFENTVSQYGSVMISAIYQRR